MMYLLGLSTDYQSDGRVIMQILTPPVAKGGNILNGRLSDKQVARTVKARLPPAWGSMLRPSVVIPCARAS